VFPVVAGPDEFLALRVSVPGLGTALDEKLKEQAIVVVADLSVVACLEYRNQVDFA
jgi:hypothetical protein